MRRSISVLFGSVVAIFLAGSGATDVSAFGFEVEGRAVAVKQCGQVLEPNTRYKLSRDLSFKLNTKPGIKMFGRKALIK